MCGRLHYLSLTPSEWTALKIFLGNLDPRRNPVLARLYCKIVHQESLLALRQRQG